MITSAETSSGTRATSTSGARPAARVNVAGAHPAPAAHTHAAHTPAKAAGPVESRDARRERILLLCAVDRARLRLLWRLPNKPKTATPSVVESLFSPPTLATILPWVPGRIGRWSRRIRAGVGLAGLFRSVLRAAA